MEPRNIDKSIFLKKSTPRPEEEYKQDHIDIESIKESVKKTQEADHILSIKRTSDEVISIENLNHTFDKGTEHEYTLFKDFNFSVKDIPGKPQVVSIMGGSGCGKSCLLRSVAGLMKVDSGDIKIYDRPLAEYGHIPMVFQAYSNYEWMTVLDNIALPMVLKGMKKAEAREKAKELVKLVGLEEHMNKYAKGSMLSGGQLQRISIARCLATGSQIMLLDEATGALDIKMKKEVQDLILKICRESELDMTILNVTHSVEEALYISNKVVILKANPCTIYKTVDVDYGENDMSRGQWVLESQLFSDYSKEVSGYLDEVCR